MDGILEYSRIGRIKEKISSIDLNLLLKEVIELLLIPSHIKIHVQEKLPTLHFEKIRLHQLFQNLLTNAIQYMDKPQGEIEISCIDKEAMWEFHIKDNGPGIHEKYFDKIFEMFQTLQSKDKQASTGIGLSLVKRIIEDFHHGKVFVLKSEPNVGTTFRIVLKQA